MIVTSINSEVRSRCLHSDSHPFFSSCFCSGQSTLFWMSAQVPSASMWRERSSRLQRILGYPCYQSHTDLLSGKLRPTHMHALSCALSSIYTHTHKNTQTGKYTTRCSALYRADLGHVIEVFLFSYKCFVVLCGIHQ